MAPVPRAGRRKIAVLQDRTSKRRPVHLNTDFPEDLADTVGSIDFWLKAVKAFRWHDEQLDLFPDHAVTRHGVSVLLGMDRDEAMRLLHRMTAGKARLDVYLWKDVRPLVLQKMIKSSMDEMLGLLIRMAITPMI